MWEQITLPLLKDPGILKLIVFSSPTHWFSSSANYEVLWERRKTISLIVINASVTHPKKVSANCLGHIKCSLTQHNWLCRWANRRLTGNVDWHPGGYVKCCWMTFLCPFPKHIWMIGIDLGMPLSNRAEGRKSQRGFLFTMWQLDMTSTHTVLQGHDLSTDQGTDATIFCMGPEAPTAHRWKLSNKYYVHRQIRDQSSGLVCRGPQNNRLEVNY